MESERLCMHIHQKLPHKLRGFWYTWVNGCVTLLYAANVKMIPRDVIEELEALISENQLCICIGSVFSNILDCSEQFENIWAIPAFQNQDGSRFLFCDDWKEFGLL